MGASATYDELLDVREIAYRHQLAARLQKRTGRPCGVRSGYLYTDLPNGEIGWCQVRWDECLRMAVATLLQIPPSEVPDLHVDRRMEAGESADEIAAQVNRTYMDWAAERGLQITAHRNLPVDRERWLGVVPQPGYFQNHVVVMRRRKVHFEVVPAAAAPKGYRVKRFQLGDIAEGVTFDPIEKGSNRWD